MVPTLALKKQTLRLAPNKLRSVMNGGTPLACHQEVGGKPKSITLFFSIFARAPG